MRRYDDVFLGAVARETSATGKRGEFVEHNPHTGGVTAMAYVLDLDAG
jgi:hypothetical protein